MTDGGNEPAGQGDEWRTALDSRLDRLESRTARLEEIIPTLATKQELRTEVRDAVARIEIRFDELAGETRRQLDEVRQHVDARAEETQRHFDAKAEETQRHFDGKAEEMRRHVDAKAEEVQRHFDAKAEEVQRHFDEKGEQIERHLDQRAGQMERHVAAKAEETRRHFHVVAERIEDHIRLAMEGTGAVVERLDQEALERRRGEALLEARLTRLEVKKPRRRRP